MPIKLKGRVRSCARSAFVLVTVGALHVGTPASRTPQVWILAYAGDVKGSRPRYTVDDFTRLVAEVDTAGRPVAWLCTGAIFVQLWPPSGRVFPTWIGGAPATGQDWADYLDSLFLPGGFLQRLDSSVTLVGRRAGALPEPFRVAIQIPYPEPRADSLRFKGRLYDLKSGDGRVAAASAFLREAESRFRSHQQQIRRLSLEGFYWLNEAVPQTDSAVVARVANEVHAKELRFFWIPYFTAEGQRNWRAFGFDQAWLQPNFFFHPEIHATRLDSALSRAKQLGMGLELEFDGRIYTDSAFSNRLDPYLGTLLLHPELRALSLVLYEGGGALISLSRRRSPRDRLTYARLVAVLRTN